MKTILHVFKLRLLLHACCKQQLIYSQNYSVFDCCHRSKENRLIPNNFLSGPKKNTSIWTCTSKLAFGWCDVSSAWIKKSQQFIDSLCSYQCSIMGLFKMRMHLVLRWMIRMYLEIDRTPQTNVHVHATPPVCM